MEGGKIKGVDAKCTPTVERIKTDGGVRTMVSNHEESTRTFSGDAVVLATGHSARDTYYEMHRSGFELEPKGFAVGFRIEHPQVHFALNLHFFSIQSC